MTTAIPLSLSARHAVYFAPPPRSPWWEAGSHWLGRCAARGEALTQPHVTGLSPAEMHRLTAAPRRYGWHATLKAPFRLADGVSPDQLTDAVQGLCRTQAPFSLALEVCMLGDFLALVPAGDGVVEDCAAVNRLAHACVTQLHPLAAPLPPAELARRRQGGGLDARQEELLQRWGYPHVLERFRFHFSLTGPLGQEPEPVQQALVAAAQQWFGALGPCPCDAVSLFTEPGPGADFAWQSRHPLGGVA